MTVREVHKRVHDWKDYVVLAGLAVNLLVVGAMYGRVDTTLVRAKADIVELKEADALEMKERRAEDAKLRDEMVRADERLEDRVLARAQ